MKASDFVSTSSERDASARDLLHTEETDAVNTGIVGSADKSETALKGGSVIRKATKGGVSNAALAAITKGRAKKTSGRDTENATSSENGSPENMEAATAGKAGVVGHGSRLKGAAKGLAAKEVHSQLEGTELEGADDLYYKGKVVARLTKYTKGKLAASKSKRTLSLEGRGVEKPGKPLGGLSEKGHKAAKGTIEAKRKEQMTRYFKRSVYSSAGKVKIASKASGSVIKRLTVSTGGGLKAAIGALGSSVLFPLFLIIALVLVISAAGGALGSSSANDSSSASLSDVERQVASYLMSQGLDELHTAAIMGNMYAESGMNPSATESGGTGIGICQWSYGRANSLRSYAASQGKSWSDLSVQLDFFWNHDIWQNDWGSSYVIATHRYDGDPAVGETVSGSKSGFMETDDLTDAVKQFCYGWERPGIPRINVRLEAAQRYYTALTTGGYTGGGEEYDAAEDWQKRIVDACYNTPWPGESLCATWVSNVYERAGFDRPYGNGNSILNSSTTTSTDWDNIKVGQILSAQASGTYMGSIYGHTAIYIGDGMVMESTSGGVQTQPLSDWLDYYGSYGWVKYGWPW